MRRDDELAELHNDILAAEVRTFRQRLAAIHAHLFCCQGEEAVSA